MRNESPNYDKEKHFGTTNIELKKSRISNDRKKTHILTSSLKIKLGSEANENSKIAHPIITILKSNL